MTEEFTVAKWGQAVELAEAPCGGCGQPMLYNLAIGCVVHADHGVDPCDGPWPDEPRPQWVKDAFARAEADAETIRRGSAILDRQIASGFPGWTEGYLFTEEETLPQALTGYERREAFKAAGRIAASGVAA